MRTYDVRTDFAAEDSVRGNHCECGRVSERCVDPGMRRRVAARDLNAGAGELGWTEQLVLLRRSCCCFASSTSHRQNHSRD